MIFTIRQLSEKAVAHRTKQFFVFVDIRKAYEPVSCETLWKVLEKLGVPEVLITIVSSAETINQFFDYLVSMALFDSLNTIQIFVNHLFSRMKPTLQVEMVNKIAY